MHSDTVQNNLNTAGDHRTGHIRRESYGKLSVNEIGDRQKQDNTRESSEIKRARNGGEAGRYSMRNDTDEVMAVQT
jgi:hypothetical protein